MNYRRSGYTLLEVLLALGIATMLLAGLYATMDVQIRMADAGRARVDDAAIARALLGRISNDVSAALTPIRASEAAASGGTASSTATTGSSTSGATTPTTGGTTTPTDSSSSADAGTSSLTAVMPLNAGVQGEVGRLVLYISRIPGAGLAPADAEGAPNGGPDQRRVAYWLVPDRGLARQEICRVTADDEGAQLPPDIADESQFIVAPEVVGLEFRFFDGTAWIDLWEGATPGDDGATPIGPPRAVEIKLAIRSTTNPNQVKTYRHVVAVQAANAQPVAPTTDSEVVP